MTSGRFTPAAATAISTSPGPATGTGRDAARSTSGPPEPSGSIAVIAAGTVVIWSRLLGNRSIHAASQLTQAAMKRRFSAYGPGRALPGQTRRSAGPADA